MAIYKNREVSVISPVSHVQPPSTIVVRYIDGSHETVSLGQVRFTEDEKKSLVKTYPSQFDNVEVVSDEDLKAVRLGVTPPSDPDLKRQAEDKARQEKMAEETQKTNEALKKDADKKLEKELNAPADKTPVSNTEPKKAK